MAACFAAERSRVTVFEQQKTAGRKILITGNGRCNISNRAVDVSRYHGGNPAVVRNIFARFGPEETESFFLSIGIPFVEEGAGKLFPASLQASSVQKLLVYEAQRRGAELCLHRRVDQIIPGKKGITLVTAGHERRDFDAVILAAGSCAYPQLGASNSGYELAAALGHTVRPPFPSIIPITIPMKSLHRLEGIKWDCAVSVVREGKTLARSVGELLFTKYGISGPVSLDVSRWANEEALAGREAEIEIDFFPETGEDDLFDRCSLLWNDPDKTAAFSLIGILKERMGDVILPAAGIDPLKRMGDIPGQERRAIVKALQEVSDNGGTSLVRGRRRSSPPGAWTPARSDPSTMESRLVKGLYITGEVLDIDGDSGGFNLQFAWSTGALAGMSAV